MQAPRRPQLAYDYLIEGTGLRDTEAQGYKAAGLIPLSIDRTRRTIHALLGLEYRRGELQLHVCGGKREPHETQAWTTAVREFNEETLHMFPASMCVEMWQTQQEGEEYNTGAFGVIRPPQQEIASAWVLNSKYAVHFVHVPSTPEILNISSKHRAALLQHNLRQEKLEAARAVLQAKILTPKTKSARNKPKSKCASTGDSTIEQSVETKVEAEVQMQLDQDADEEKAEALRALECLSAENIELTPEEIAMCEQAALAPLDQHFTELQKLAMSRTLAGDLMHSLVWVNLDEIMDSPVMEKSVNFEHKSNGDAKIMAESSTEVSDSMGEEKQFLSAVIPDESSMMAASATAGAGAATAPAEVGTMLNAGQFINDQLIVASAAPSSHKKKPRSKKSKAIQAEAVDAVMDGGLRISDTSSQLDKSTGLPRERIFVSLTPTVQVPLHVVTTNFFRSQPIRRYLAAIRSALHEEALTQNK